MLRLPVSRLLDPARLAALDEAGLRERPPREIFDRLTRLGARVLRAPVTAITMVESDEQIILSQSGLSEPWASRRAVPLEYSFCRHVVASGEPLIVEDARRHPLLQGNPAIRELGVVSYAGMPWRTPDGLVQGTYCAVDRVPRPWTAEEVGILEELAGMVTGIVARNVALRRASAQSTMGRAPPLSAFLEQSFAGVYVLQAARISYVNPRLAEIFGYTEPELLALGDVLELVAAPDRDRFARELLRRREGEERSALQSFRGLHKDGRPLWLEAEAMRVVIGGQPAIAGVVLDVTARKQSEEALRASEERLRQVVRATSDVIREWELASGALRWSEEAGHTLRYMAHELGAHVEWWYERIHPEDRDRVFRKVQTLTRGTGDLWEDEYRLVRGDGSYATVLDRGYVVRDERGTALRVVSAMMDVTDSRRNEEAQRVLAQASVSLDESLEPDTALVQLARYLVPALADFCAIDVIDDGGTIRRVAAEHIRPAETKLLAAEGQADAVRADPLVSEVVRTRKPVLIPVFDDSAARRLGDGAGRSTLRRLDPGSVMIVPLLSRERVLGVLTLGSVTPSRRYDPLDLAIAEDVGRRAAMALRNARLYRDAQDAMAAREDVLNMVSHDLRNPLSTIRMSTDILLDTDAERRKETRKWLSMIRRATERMDGIIEDLLDLTRIDHGDFLAEAADHDVAALLDEVAEALEPLATQQAIHFDCRADEDVPCLWADRRQILRVFSNLVGNAFKFTPENGRVEIRAQRQGADVLFTVRDTGPGIPPEHLPHVFDRYWQAREGDRRGVGLGLAISRTMVEAHGGRIWAESTPGQGATFYFTVPASQCEATDRRETPAAEVDTAAGAVDDPVPVESA